MSRATATSSDATPSVATRRSRRRTGPHRPAPFPSSASPRIVSGLFWLLIVASSFASTNATGQPASDASADREAILLDAANFRTVRQHFFSFGRASLSESVSTGGASARHCRIQSSRVSCRCLTLQDRGWRWTVGDFRIGPKGRELRRVRAHPIGSRWSLYASRMRSTDDAAMELRDVWVFGAEGRAFRAETALLGDDGKHAVHLEGASWGRADVVADAEGCLGEVPPREMRRTQLRAETVSFDGSQWEFRRFRQVHPVPTPLGRVRQRAAGPVGGLAPPRLVYSAETLELRDWLFDGPSGLGASLALAPTDWYGAGPSILTSPADQWLSMRPRHAELLDAQLLYDQTSAEVGWVATGSARRGGRHVHAAGHFEEMSSDRYWRTRRVTRPGFLRPWRHSAVGASLSSASHHLHLRAAKWSPSSVDAIGSTTRQRLARELPGDQAELRLQFGMSHRPADGIELATDVFHRNMARSDQLDDHGTTLATAVTATAGDPGRLFADGRMGAVVGTQLTSPEGSGSRTTSGFDAAGTTQLVAGARGGLTLRGEFSSATHTIRPTVTAYRELLGAGGGTAPASPFGAPYARTSRWTLAAGVLEQSLQWPQFGIDLPTGLVAQGTGFEGAFGRAPHWFQRLEFGWSRLAFQAGGTVGLDGSEPGLFARTRYSIDRWSAALDATTLDARGVAMVRADRLLARTTETLRLIQGQNAGPAAASVNAVVETLSIAWSSRSTRLELRGFSRQLFDRAGLGAGWTWIFPRLGWGLGLDGSWGATEGRWGIAAGLSTSAAASSTVDHPSR